MMELICLSIAILTIYFQNNTKSSKQPLPHRTWPHAPVEMVPQLAAGLDEGRRKGGGCGGCGGRGGREGCGGRGDAMDAADVVDAMDMTDTGTRWTRWTWGSGGYGGRGQGGPDCIVVT